MGPDFPYEKDGVCYCDEECAADEAGVSDG